MKKRNVLDPLGWTAVVLGLMMSLPACRRAERGTRDVSFYQTVADGGQQQSVLSMDFSGIRKPSGPEAFSRIAHLPPVRQDKTGTCWAFAATSLLESELERMGRPVVKLSEMHTVYWEYVEKARRFIREKGGSFLGQGSEPDSALARIGEYGIVRESDYRGLLPGAVSHDHSLLFKEFRDFLRRAAERGDWEEDRLLAGVRDILDRHLGRPPETIVVDDRTLTPKQYLQELGLRHQDYVGFLSFQHLPFYARGEYRVPDNWSRKADYLNLPLDEFYEALRGALAEGYSAVLAVDFSEPGYSGGHDIAVVPSFDIPSSHIDQSSRELRFANGTSTDDHAVHCVGWKRDGEDDWFLIKDSWENAYEGAHPGYFFYRGDYLRLKGLMFLTHREAVRDILAKFPEQ